MTEPPKSSTSAQREAALRLARGPVQTPGPSNEQLEDWADLVAHVNVIDILWSQDPEQPHLARLKPYRIVKGTPTYRRPLLAKLRLDQTIEVRVRRIKRDERGRPLPGQWSDGYRVGDHVITHLIWDADTEAYLTLAWNAVWQTP